MAASRHLGRQGSRHRRAWVLITMIAALILAACGGDDTAGDDGDPSAEPSSEVEDTPTSGGETASPVAEETTDEPFKIGASISQTGNFAPPATGMRQGFELWVDMINDKGGLNGRPVEMVIYDDESNADLARTLAERLIRQDEVDVLFGPYSSGLSAVMAVVSEREEVPLFAGTASDGGIWEERQFNWTFQSTIDSAYDVYNFLDAAVAQGAETIVIVRDASSAPHTRSGTFAEEYASEVGLDILEVLEFESEDRDFSSIIERIAQLQPDVVAQTGYDAVSVEVINGLAGRGVQLDGYFSSLATLPSISDPVGGALDGIFGRDPWHPALETHGNAEMISAYEEAHGDAGELNYHVGMAYAVGQVLEGAVAGSGSTDPAEIAEYVKNNPIETVIGTHEVDERLSNTGYAAFLSQWQGDEPSVVWPEEVATADIVWPKPEW